MSETIIKKSSLKAKLGIFIAGAVTVLVVLYLCTSCTTSVTTISSHGTASDMVDQQQDANPTISPSLTIPPVR